MAPTISFHRLWFAAIASCVAAFATSGQAQDWPMWRFDAQRSAAAPHEAPENLQLLWQRDFGSRTQAWDDPLNQDLMTYDRLLEPIVLGGKLFVGFNDRDKLLAIDANSGEDLWSAFAEAPVRFPAVGIEDRVLFCSDDGWLYCCKATDGSLLWKFNAAPAAQHAIGNKRLSSAWPARGGPVVRDGTVYFASSIWPFMGTFLYALDAETGEVQWVNDRTGAQYIKQPHSAPSFAGVGPQGALVATADALVVPGGRSVPAVFDRATGELRYFEINAGGKGTGGSFVIADEKNFYVHTRLKGTRAFDLASGVKTAFMPNEPVLSGGIIYSAELDEETPVIRAYGIDEQLIWQVSVDGGGDLILAGDKLIAAGAEAISIVALPHGETPAQVVATLPVDGQVERLLVADKKLFAVTLDGRLLAYGNGRDQSDSQAIAQVEQTPKIAEQSVASGSDSEEASQVAECEGLLSGVDPSGYAIWYGNTNDKLLQSLVGRSVFAQLAIVDDNAERVDELRRKLDADEKYGSTARRTVTAHVSKPAEFKPPRYVAGLVVVADSVAETIDARTLKAIYAAVRPYGGRLQLLSDEQNVQKLLALVSEVDLEQAKCEIVGHRVQVTRDGALPGAADWTHQYGDIANTIKSDDQRVKLPLGVLWFGGNSNTDVLPRHGHGPPEQVVGGRLFIQGMNSLSARDVYTGRVLWKRNFDDLGTYDVYYDQTYEDTPLDPKYNQVHIPGANGRGTNYVVTEDRVYIVEGGTCHVLDPLTGNTLQDIHLPSNADGESETWGYIGVYEDVLIGGLGFARYLDRNGLAFESDLALSTSRAGFGSKSLDRAASMALLGFDRKTGEQLWKVDAKHSFWHNGIVAGGGKVYCLDRNPQKIEEALQRRGKLQPDSYRIAAFDARTGETVWEVKENIFGTWLGYSTEHDLLLQAGAQGSDRLYDEIGQGMAVYAGSDGELAWKNDNLNYAGPCILHNDLIMTNANSYTESAGAFYIKTGQPKMVKNPLTGEIQPWKVTRAYGCNNIIASENLLTFRSGAAGFYDLLTDSGTGNLGGFKSGCTSNLVVANGVLNAPDYTRTCSCSYQNQTSLALVHMPDIDLWSINSAATAAASGEDIEQLGINFGAPGDRRDADGNLWLEFPIVSEPSPPLTIQFNPEAKFFQFHSSTMQPLEHPWVLASGVEGITTLRVGLKVEDPIDLTAGIPVLQISDDAEENEQGEVDLTSSDLELVEDDGNQLVGLRFNNLKLARGTKIRAAHLQFVCDETSAGEPTSLVIAAEDAGDAAGFTESSHDLSSRTRTRQEVAWEPAEWTRVDDANDAQRTPDLATLVQAIVDRKDWRPGNSIVFLINGTGKRVAVASKGNGGGAARLVLDADETAVGEEVDDTGPKRRVDIRFLFAAPKQLGDDPRVFDVFIGSKLVLENVTLQSGSLPPKAGVQQTEFLVEDISVGDTLSLKFVPKQGKPILSGLHITSHNVTE